jgi:glycosyltransferase involved in cell wall biosynthesis
MGFGFRFRPTTEGKINCFPNSFLILHSTFCILHSSWRLAMQRTVLIITYYFPPSGEVGVQRPAQIARLSPKVGWRPVILTVKPEAYRENQKVNPEGCQAQPGVYRTRVTRPARHLTQWGKRLIPGGSKEGKRSGDDSQRVADECSSVAARKRLLPKATRIAAQRLTNFVNVIFSTPDEEIGWLPFAFVKGLRLLRKEKVDVIYTTSPPHSAHLIGYGLKWLTEIPWIADFQDPWTLSPWHDSLVKQSLAYQIETRMEAKIMDRADRVIFNTTHAMAEHMKHYGEALAQKSIAIPNGFDPEDMERLTRNGKTKRPKGKLTLLHAGTLYRKRNPLPLIEAVHRLHRQGILSVDNFHLAFVGKATMEEEANERIQELGLTELAHFSPPVQHEECLRLMRDAEALLLLQPETRLQVPAKLYEYGYLQKPILAITEPDGAAADIIKQHQMGVIAPNTVEAIVDGLIKLLDDFQNGWKTYRYSKSALQAYNAHCLINKFAEALDNVCRASELQ